MALRVQPTNPLNTTNVTWNSTSGTLNVNGGIVVNTSRVANNATSPMPNPEVDKYLKIARINFTSTYNRTGFDIEIALTGSFKKRGTIRGFFSNESVKNSVHVSSFGWVVNSHNQNFAANDVKYISLDAGTGNDFIIDVYVLVREYANVFANVLFKWSENNAVLTLNPDSGLLVTTLPEVSTTTTIGGVTYTYAAAYVSFTNKIATLT